MKKATIFTVFALILALLAGAAASIVFLRYSDSRTTDSLLGKEAPKVRVSPSECTTGKLSALALEAAGYIKADDFVSLAEMVHPEYGVVISPSATVSLPSNKCFTADEVSRFGTDKEVYMWGIADGLGDPIKMKAADYFQSYVYDFDYVNAPVLGVNHIVKTGNSLENISNTFPGAQFVDMNNPGTSESSYNNWTTLRLVFEDYKGKMMLTAIIHSKSTL